MSSKQHLSTPQIAALFDEIARAANQADMAVFYTRVPIEDVDYAETLIDTLRLCIRRIGWLADRGAAGVGGSTLRGNPDEWLMSPRWVDLHNQARQKRGGSDAE